MPSRRQVLVRHQEIAGTAAAGTAADAAAGAAVVAIAMMPLSRSMTWLAPPDTTLDKADPRPPLAGADVVGTANNDGSMTG